MNEKVSTYQVAEKELVEHTHFTIYTQHPTNVDPLGTYLRSKGFPSEALALGFAKKFVEQHGQTVIIALAVLKIHTEARVEKL